jgi:S1-C subfamily serine protease
VDLALLTVSKPAFWEGAMQLNIGGNPRLQQEVHVIGYPLGGEGICITAGVVSRVDYGEYAQSKKSNLSVQVDAAINSGNR